MVDDFLIKPLESMYVDDISRIHADSLEGDFLSIMGPSFLRQIYGGLCSSSDSFGFVALSGDRVAGFVTGSLDTGKLFNNILFKKFFHMSFLVFFRLLKNPFLLKNVFQTFFYNGKMDELVECKSELISLAVNKDFRRMGLARTLTNSLVDEFRRRGVSEFKLTVNQSNVPANSFYKNFGFVYKGFFELYSKNMNAYVFVMGDE